VESALATRGVSSRAAKRGTIVLFAPAQAVGSGTQQH